MFTPDRRYLVVRGRLWRATNPQLSAVKRTQLTATLMRARRAVADALCRGDEETERAARRRVHRAKVALGERGPVWWTDGAPDFSRRLVRNTPYLLWYEQAQQWEDAILFMLKKRGRAQSICPSEVARQIEPRGWRKHMDNARDAARRLAQRGAVVIMQRGKTLDPNAEFRGPIRISTPRIRRPCVKPDGFLSRHDRVEQGKREPVASPDE